MRIVAHSIHPRVSIYRDCKRPIKLTLGDIRFEMSKGEAIDLANALADAVESVDTPEGVTGCHAQDTAPTEPNAPA